MSRVHEARMVGAASGDLRVRQVRFLVDLLETILIATSVHGAYVMSRLHQPASSPYIPWPYGWIKYTSKVSR